MKIGIIGCGHMGSAIAKAVLKKKSSAVWVSNPFKPGLAINWTVDNTEVVKKTRVIFIAVKPGVVKNVLDEIKPFLKKNHFLISIAAGISLKNLKKWSGNHSKIARVMPNLAAQVFEGVSVWKASSGITKQEKNILQNILGAFGKSIEVDNENLINVATAISGGAPAYVAAFLESMAWVANKNGFGKEEARALALQSVYGSTVYIKNTGIDFSSLKQAVQTKGGTTEAAFKILTRGKWQKNLEDAIIAAYKRAGELG